MKKSLTQADAIMLGGAGLTFLFSFVGFTSWTNAWGSGVRFIATLPAIMALVLLAIAIAELVGTELPPKVATFTLPQIKVVLATIAALVMFAWATVSGDKSFAFWLQLLGSAAAAAGAWAALMGQLATPLIPANTVPPPPPGAPQPPTPDGPVPPQPGQVASPQPGDVAPPQPGAAPPPPGNVTPPPPGAAPPPPGNVTPPPPPAD